MALFGRRVRLPAGLRALLAPDERVLAVAEDGPAAVAATQFGLWLPVAEGPVADGAAPAGWRRIGWDQVVKATWGEEGLQVIEGELDAGGVVTDRPARTLRLAEPRNLPAVVRTRVEASIARWEQVRVPGGTARIVARRRAGTDGLIWTARLDTGTPDSEAARAALLDYLDRLTRSASEQPFLS
ncbi:hypothetical protein [Jatrophihabitans sp.]|uniref:hypothetical protein n=1 Tax=Jatrophihabitans sp. TaxID=1932789 RepID=UPI002CE117A1|nr:hypothetical protein [Jatrophihabitans sp.]